MTDKFNIEILPYTLHFKQPAGTSRGIYTERKVWYIKITDGTDRQRTGIGEVAPLPNLSCDDQPNFEEQLQRTCKQFDGIIPYEQLRPFPSILFGIETAWARYVSYPNAPYKTPFTCGEEGILINGLIWMGTYEEMKKRIDEKLALGFHCIKVKIGAIDFEKEYALLQKIRNEYDEKEICLRVDANGGFLPDEALNKLNRLAKLNIHSIEQPIRANQREKMAHIVRHSPIPIALDEELIGVNTIEDKIELLEQIMPHYLILKPSLHGGIHGCEEWIRLAKERNIGYWVTSALESNVGLLAIAEWASTLGIGIPQGLGTGALFTNNIDTPLVMKGERLWEKKD